MRVPCLSNNGSKSPVFLVFFGVGLVYFFHISPFVDLGRNLPQVLSILDLGSLAINETMAGYRAFPDLSQFGDNIYPGVAPGLTFFTVPLYAIFRFLLRLSGQNVFPGMPLGEESLVIIPVTFVLAALPALLCAYMLFKFSLEKNLDERQAYFVAILYAVGSPAFSYALNYNLSFHNLGNFFALYAFFEIFRKHSRRPAGNYAFVGLSLGLLPFLWYPAGLISIILGGIFLMREPRGALKLAVPAFLIPIIILLIYNWSLFGHPLSLPYHHRIDPLSVSIDKGLFGSGLPSPAIAIKLLVSTRRGLFLTVPFAVLSMMSAAMLFSGWNRRGLSHLWSAWAVFSVFFLWNASRTVFWDGANGIFGPRYLMSALPFLFVMLIYVFRRIAPVGLAFLGAFSFLINMAGAHYKQPFDIDSLILFVTKGPAFPMVQWLNAMPKEAMSRFPDLFPVSQWSFSVSVVLFMAFYFTIAILFWNRPPPRG